MAVKDVGHAALQGWRQQAADRIAPALSRRTPLSEDTVRAALGLIFLGLTLRYLVRTLRGTARA